MLDQIQPKPQRTRQRTVLENIKINMDLTNRVISQIHINNPNNINKNEKTNLKYDNF